MFQMTPQATSLSSGDGGGSEGEAVGRTCEEILGRIPSPFHVDAALARYPTLREQSLNTVLVQEMSRYNTLINTITTTLHAVLRAIEGIDMLSS